METVKGKPSLEDELQVHLDRIAVIRKELSEKEKAKKEAYRGRYFQLGKGRVFKVDYVKEFCGDDGHFMDCHGLVVGGDDMGSIIVDGDAYERIDLSYSKGEISEGDFAMKVIDAIDLIKKATPMLSGPAEHLGGILAGIVGGTPDVINWSKQVLPSAANGPSLSELLKEMEGTVPTLKGLVDKRIGRVSEVGKALTELWKERFGQDLTDEKFAELAAMIPDQPKDPNQLEIDFEPISNLDLGNLIKWLLDKYEISYYHAESLLRNGKRVTLQDGTTVIAIDESGLKPRSDVNQGQDS